MNVLLWTLQVLAACLYLASGVMKAFMLDEVSVGVASFGALPREAWMALGILELVCAVGLIVPAALRWRPRLTGVAAAVLAVETLVFVGVHVKYRETGPTIMSGLLGCIMAFIAYGRLVLRPIPVRVQQLASLVVLLLVAGCSRPFYVGTDGVRVGADRPAAPPAGSPALAPGDSSGGAELRLFRKRVASMEAPTTLVAQDRSRCTVTADRFRKVRVGDWATCAWHGAGR